MSSPRLPEAARAPLREAHDSPFSYRVRYLLGPDRRHLLVVLGEAHVKLKAAHALGERIVSSFPLRGVETFPSTVTGARLLRWLVHGPRWLLMRLSFGLVRGSTITSALSLDEGATFKLEREDDVPLSLHVAAVYLTLLHLALIGGLLGTALTPVLGSWLLVPVALVQLHFTLTILPAILLRRLPWSWWINPAVAILTIRDRTMADGTGAMMAAHPEAESAVVVMGRAHVRGYTQHLVDRGWVEVDPALVSGP